MPPDPWLDDFSALNNKFKSSSRSDATSRKVYKMVIPKPDEADVDKGKNQSRPENGKQQLI